MTDSNSPLRGPSTAAAAPLLETVTATVEHRTPVGIGETILRLEYRFDESTGPQGGFYKKVDDPGEMSGLTAAQHLLIFSAIWTFSARP